MIFNPVRYGGGNAKLTKVTTTYGKIYGTRNGEVVKGSGYDSQTEALDAGTLCYIAPVDDYNKPTSVTGATLVVSTKTGYGSNSKAGVYQVDA